MFRMRGLAWLNHCAELRGDHGVGGHRVCTASLRPYSSHALSVIAGTPNACTDQALNPAMQQQALPGTQKLP